MIKISNLIDNLVQSTFKHRYVVCLIITFAIITFGIYLHFWREWKFKDAAQVCGGFMLLITIFFTALNYEFIANKTKNEARILTYNIAAEFHKSPAKDYQLTIVKAELTYIEKNRLTLADLESYIVDPVNLEYRVSLNSLLNYFETVAICVNKDLINKEFIKEFHFSIFRQYYSDYHPFISSRRLKENKPSMFINFTNLAEEWHPELKSGAFVSRLVK